VRPAAERAPPYLRDTYEQFEPAKADLRRQLGREPTDEELVAYAGRRRAGER
jgi:DNA-directed RNA polymerase specialized sigma subunit